MIRPALLIAALAATLLGFGLWQDRLRRTAPLLPVTFAHSDHQAVNCATCHHNYLDDTGAGLCFDCHKTDPRVNALVEQQFHGFCMGCHVDRQRAGEDGGPTRACASCHTADEAP